MENIATKSNAEKFREWAQFVILLGAGVWAAATYYHKEIYVPSNRPASLAVTGSLEEIGRKGNLALVRAKVHVVNKREVKIYVPALYFTVTGTRFWPQNEPLPPDEICKEDGSLTQDDVTLYSDREPEVLTNWKLPGWDAYYEQDGESTHEQLFYVPLKKYHALQINVAYFIARNTEAIADVTWKIDKEIGTFAPTIWIKKVGYESNNQLAEELKPEKNQHHKDLMKRDGMGWEFPASSLSFLPAGKARRNAGS